MTPQINSCAYAATVCVASALESGVDVEVWWPVSFQPSPPENFITIALKQGASDENSICNSQLATSLNSVLQEWTVTPTIVDSTNTISGTNISIYYSNLLENAIASCNSFYLVIFNNYDCLSGPNLTYNSFQIFSRLPTTSSSFSLTDNAAPSTVSSYSSSLTPIYTPTIGESADSAQTLSNTGITAVSLSLVTLFVSSLAAILFVMYLRKRERRFLPWLQRKSYRNVKCDSGEFLVVSVDHKGNSDMVESNNSLGFNEVQHEIVILFTFYYRIMMKMTTSVNN